MPWDVELEAFKMRIDLREYALAAGYVLDRAESSRNAAVMRRGADKISISRLPDDHYVYYSFRDDLDRGSIVDFVQRRKGFNLGEVRKELRAWCSLPVARPHFWKIVTSTKDRMRVLREFSRMRVVEAHPYLEKCRGIPRKILEHERFAGFGCGCVYMDQRGNAIFPHYDFFPYFHGFEGRVEPCGYEIKNVGFTGFAKGGTKGLWTSVYHPGLCFNDQIVICESAIDALSHAVLFPAQALYVSIAGQLSSVQADLITLLVNEVEPEEVSNLKVVAAMDSDEAGAELVYQVLIAAERSGRKGLECYEHIPQGYKDWNEQLLAEQPKVV